MQIHSKVAVFVHMNDGWSTWDQGKQRRWTLDHIPSIPYSVPSLPLSLNWLGLLLLLSVTRDPNLAMLLGSPTSPVMSENTQNTSNHKRKFNSLSWNHTPSILRYVTFLKLLIWNSSLEVRSQITKSSKCPYSAETPKGLGITAIPGSDKQMLSWSRNPRLTALVLSTSQTQSL